LRTNRILVLLLLSSAASVSAFDLELPTRYFSAAALGSGGNNTAFANSISTVSYNPAGLAKIGAAQFLMSYSVVGREIFVANLATAFPLEPVNGMTLMFNFIYVNNAPVHSFIPGIAAGYQFGFLIMGLQGSYVYDYNFPRERSYPAGKFGLLFTPAFLRFGTVLEHYAVRGDPAWIVRAQGGASLFNARLKPSIGFSKDLREDFPFLFNVGLDWNLLDFLSLCFSYEDDNPSFGISLNSYETKLSFSTLYRSGRKDFDFNLSFVYQP
jgi:hypothetical protein